MIYAFVSFVALCQAQTPTTKNCEWSTWAAEADNPKREQRTKICADESKGVSSTETEERLAPGVGTAPIPPPSLAPSAAMTARTEKAAAAKAAGIPCTDDKDCLNGTFCNTETDTCRPPHWTNSTLPVVNTTLAENESSKIGSGSAIFEIGSGPAKDCKVSAECGETDICNGTICIPEPGPNRVGAALSISEENGTKTETLGWSDGSQQIKVTDNSGLTTTKILGIADATGNRPIIDESTESTKTEDIQQQGQTAQQQGQTAQEQAVKEVTSQKNVTNSTLPGANTNHTEITNSTLPEANTNHTGIANSTLPEAKTNGTATAGASSLAHVFLPFAVTIAASIYFY